MPGVENLWMYRAVFAQPRKHLNPMNLRVSQAVTVEVFCDGKTGTRWKARTLNAEGNPARVLTYEDRSEIVGVSAGHCQTIVAELFETRVTPWEQLEKRLPR